MVEKVTSKKHTPLYETHLKLGAKIINFNGWEMPVQYESIIKEHETVRKNAGVFDISHMGEFLLEGKDVIPFLQYLMTNDLNVLKEGMSQYSLMCYENGTVIDDVIYYMENIEKFRLIANAGNLDKDFQWINEHIENFRVKVSNISKERCRLAFQGPKTEELINPLVKKDLSSLNRFHFIKCNLNRVPIFIARTGYTGEKGFELSFDSHYAEIVWNDLINTGASPIGLGARDTLRLEACYSLYGHEISDKISPIEANIGWVVKQKDGIDFIGKEILLRQRQEGTSRTIVGLNLLDRGIMRENYKLYKEGENIGYITSGGYSPTLKKTIGLALIRKEYSEINTELEIDIRGKLLKAKVVSTPFYRNI